VNCRNCGAELSARDARCAACGTLADEPAGSGGAKDGAARAGAETGPKAITFKIARLTRGDRIVGVASLVVFIALLLPWYGTGLFGFTVDGLWHGWMYITLLVAIATVGYLAALAAVEVRLPVPHWQALVGATGIMLLLVVIGVATTPTGASLEWGAVVGLVAAVAALAGALLRRSEPATA
jgi:hypothetical protein